MSLSGTPITETPDDSLTGFLPVLSQSLTTPADYFRQGAELPENLRNERMYVYSELYDGRYEAIANVQRDHPIVFQYSNWFAFLTDLIVDFLMSAPPESSSPAQAMLNDVLPEAIVHYLMHGVAVFSTEDGDEDRIVECVDPKYLYPLDDDTFVTVQPHGPKTILVQDNIIEQLYQFETGSIENWLYPNGKLGAPMGDPVVIPQRTFFSVAAKPYDGMFGNSTYRAASPEVAANTGVTSDFRAAIKLASNILSAEVTDLDGGVVEGLPPIGEERAAGTDNKPAESTIKLAQLYGSLVKGLSLSFVHGEVNDRAYMALSDSTERRICDRFGLNDHFVKQVQGGGLTVASGVALDKMYLRSTATFNKIIKAFLPVLEKVLEDLGSPAEITWPNPLKALSEEVQASAATGDADAEEDETDGDSDAA